MNNLKKSCLTLLLSLAMIITYMPMSTITAYAKAGDVPQHEKTISSNDDGTYKLSLSVKGEAERIPQKVNVIVILDRSGSMRYDSGVSETTYTKTTTNSGGLYGTLKDDPDVHNDDDFFSLTRYNSGDVNVYTYPSQGSTAYTPGNNNNHDYGLVNGEYVHLTYTTSFFRRTWYANGQPYYGVRYQLRNNVAAYTGDRYTRQTSQTRLQATQAAVNSLANSLLSHNEGEGNDTVEMALVSFSSGSATTVQPTTDYSTFETGVNGLTANGGTNWESALIRANGINFGDTDPTYVIFFSDGAPTMYGNNQGSGQEDTDNMNTSYNAARDDAQTLANKVGPSNFYTIFAYGESYGATYMSNLTEYAGAPAENNYSASNTAALQQAFNEILEKIEMSGIADVEIDDGTPANIQVGESSTEVADLLEVEEGSFKYYKTDANGNKTEWTDIPDSCKAKNDNGTVKWNLEEAGVLENGVTYTVEFNVYPSQYTYDLIAQLKNGEKTYEELPQAVRDYLKKTGNNSYGLKTNTSATLKYDDTRNTDPAQTVSYNELDPVATDASTMAVKKDWEVPEDAKEIQMAVLQDGKDYLSVTLNEGNSWTKDPVYIAIGLMRAKGNDVEVLDPGYDYSFAELGTDQYNWELDAPTVHPMLVNGTLTMLTLVDDDHPAGDAKTYKIGNNTYFESGTDKVTLNAKNYKRSTLNVKKVVDGKDAPKDATFPFTMTVNNAKAKEGKADDIKSDYYVWFSVYNGGFVERDIIGTGVQKEMKDGEWTGYYYAPSGTSLTVNLKANDNLRFLNVPTGSDYTITEGELATGFSFVNATLDPKTDGTAGRTTSGTITKTNTDYQATYNNRYDLTNVSITKKWDDNKNNDGKRVSADKFADYLTLKANGSAASVTEENGPTVVDNGDDTYTVTWTKLPRFSDNEAITYTVDESKIEGYTTEGSPAKDGGIITNKHDNEKTKVVVNKTWLGDEAANGATVHLYAEGKDTGKSATLSKENNNTYTFDNLDKYADGKEIKYTVTEDKIDGFTTSGPTGKGTEADPYVFTNTNDATVSVPVKKVWVGPEAKDGATIHLLADGKDSGKSVTLPKEKSNEYTFTNLRKFDAKDGHVVVYTVSEDKITGYTTDGPTGDAATGFIFTNTCDERVSVPVKKVWNDADDQDGKRPSNVTVHLLANGAAAEQEGVTAEQKLSEGNNWAYTWENLYKYDQTTGEEITYTITEDTVTDYSTSQETKDGVVTITNSYTPGKTSVTVTKSWEDGGNQDGIRPDGVEVTLLADGKAVTQTGITAKVTLNEENKWTYTWEELNQKKAGKDITYTVEETKTDVITGTNAAGTYAVDVTGDATTGYKVTNIHTPETVEASVKKAWDDADNQDGKRPESLTVTLSDGQTVTLNEENKWEGKITGLPKYKDGKEIKYTWTEGELPAGYEMTSNTTQGTVTTITNKHVPEETEATVKKVWEDANNQDGKRPESLTVTLSDGKTVTLNAENKWEGKITGLPKYKDGKVIEYTWTEAGLPEGYELTGQKTEGTVTTLTNKHNPEKVDVTVKKVWDDESDSSLRPKSLTVQLSDGQTVTLNEGNKWEGTISGLPKYKDGKEISYTWTETDLPKCYELTSNKAEGYVTTITNKKLEPVSVTFSGVKTLKGRDLKAGEFEFLLKDKDGKTIDTATNAADGSFAFKEISYNDVKDYNYTIVENNDKLPKGVAENSQEYKVTVSVANGGNGKLKATITGLNEDGSGANFLNVYQPAAKKVTLVGLKEVKDKVTGTKVKLDGGEFEFTITGTGVGKKQDATEEQQPEAENPDEQPTDEQTTDGQSTEDQTTDDQATNEKPADEAAPAPEAAADEKTDATESGDTVTGSLDKLKERFTAYAVDEEGADAAEFEDIEAPLPTPATVENAADGSVTFGDITFEREGVYTYKITEKKIKDSGSMSLVTNDPETEKTVIVTVTDNKEGELVATVNPESTPYFTFTNIYNTPPTDSSITSQIPVVKELAGHSLKDKSFTFELKDESGKVVATATNDAEGKVEFPAITFTKEGAYKYTVSEKKGSSSVISYDTSSYTAIANVTNKYDGKELEIKWTLENGGDKISFKNTWSDAVYIDPPVQKIVNGAPKAAETYTFKLEAMDSANPMPKAANGASSMTMSITGAGVKEFGHIDFTKPGTYSYKVSEVAGSNPDCTYDNSVYIVTATVTEDENYKLHVNTTYQKNGQSVSTASFQFVNTYKEIPEDDDNGPGTGDTNDITGMLGLMGTSAAGLMYMFFRRRREDSL